MKCISILAVLLLAVGAFAQTAAAPVFSTTSVSMSLTPLSLPGIQGTTLSGAETDVMWNPTPNNAFGETNLISSPGSLIGGRYNRVFPQFSKWFDNLSPNLNGYQLQFGVTTSLGVVKGGGFSHWGERAGAFLNYGINNTWGIGVEVQANNLPGITHWRPSFVFGPNFHF